MDSTIDLQFVEYIVKSLVGNPDAVSIARTIDEKGVLLELTVDPEDLGRVIGKRGATAQSLRTLLRALGTKNDARYNLKIVDNGEPRPPREDREPRDDRRDDRGDRDNHESRDDRRNDRNEDRDNQESRREDQEDPAEAPRESAPVSSGTVDEDAWSSSAAPAASKDDSSSSASNDEDHSDAISRTRKDLADLDDLDI